MNGEGRSRKVELTDLELDKKLNCQLPNFPEVVIDHETVQTQMGLITCGGLNSNDDGSNRCYTCVGKQLLMDAFPKHARKKIEIFHV